MNSLFKSKSKKHVLNQIDFKNSNFFKSKKMGLIAKIKNLLKNFLDERARTIDLIILLILIDRFYMQLHFLNYIYYFIFLKALMVFVGGIYLICYKNYFFK